MFGAMAFGLCREPRIKWINPGEIALSRWYTAPIADVVGVATIPRVSLLLLHFQLTLLQRIVNRGLLLPECKVLLELPALLHLASRRHCGPRVRSEKLQQILKSGLPASFGFCSVEIK